MQLSLQNKCVVIMIGIGLLIAIPLFNTFWSLLGLMLIGGGIIIFFIFYEQKWIKREYLISGLLANIILAIAYGVYEYLFFDATWNDFFVISEWFPGPDKYFYWGFMTLLNFTVVFIFSRKSIALSLASVPLFAVNEDLWYWITKSIHETHYIFPVGNWFDDRFPFLQGLGEPLPVMPYFPRFYFVGWILISILLIIQFKNLEGRKFLLALAAFITASSLFLLFVAF